jgi:uncharacterized protein YdeI (YjbR/CyaY-like superfamily)
VKTFHAKSRAEWREWLEKNHATCKEVWLVHFRTATGKRAMPIEEAVEEALCFGWIDSIQKRLDDERYAQRFNPRQEGSAWSAVNRGRAKKLIAEGRMTPAGLARFDEDAPLPQKPPRLKVPAVLPADIKRALAGNREAREFFDSLAPGYRRRYVGWVILAKQPETRARRIKEAVRVLAAGVKSLLK